MAELTLAQLVPVLQELGYPAQLVAPSDEALSETLVLLLSDEDDEAAQQLELTFLPGVDDPALLQLFALLPDAPATPVRADLARLILAINSRLPLPGFSLDERQDWVCYQAMVPCPRLAVEPNLLTGVVGMAEHFLGAFGPTIAATARDELSLDAALARVEAEFETGS